MWEHDTKKMRAVNRTGFLKMTKTRQEAAPSSKRGKYEKVRIVQFFKGLTASINE